jgi:MFS family permease
VSFLVSLGAVPILLSTGPAPAFDAPAKVPLRRLLRLAPLGVVGLFGTVMVHGAFFGMGAVYAADAGFSVRETSLFMSAMLVGGVVLQWPLGWLSDALDRRKVIVLATFLAAGFALAAGAAGAAQPLLLLAVALFGGTALPMYSLCLAQANDHLRPEEMVPAGAKLILVASIGAAIGPASAALAMALIGLHGFFLWLAAIHGAIGLFALWRMTRRPAAADQSAFVSLPPSPVASALYVETTGGDHRSGDSEARRERPSLTVGGAAGHRLDRGP